MNCDNETVIAKAKSSKDNMKSTKHIRRRLKFVKKSRNSGVIALDYIQTAKNLANERAITDCDRKCIEGDGYETHVSCHGGNPTYVIGDPVN